MSTASVAESDQGTGPLSRLLGSSVGNKAVMAITGVALVGFVIVHMLGNLQILMGEAGREAINSYAVMLKGNAGVLWTARLGLLGAVALHIITAVRLTATNRSARPVRYTKAGSVQLSFAGRTMALTGLVVLAYIVYHLLHFTVGLTHPDHFSLVDPQGRHDVYSMVVLGFQQTPVAIAYVIANLLLGLHLSHGVSSMFQSLGFTNNTYRPVLTKVGPALALVITLGFIVVPVAVWLGFVPLPA